MFAKGPRFATEKEIDTPGPGAYSPSDKFASAEVYKRGAFLENAVRFPRQKQANDPAFHPDDTENINPNLSPSLTRSRASTLSSGQMAQLRQQVEQLKAQNVKLTNEFQQERDQLHDKLAQAEAALQEARNTQVASAPPVQQATAPRNVATRVMAGKADSRDKHVDERVKHVVQLEKKLEALQRVHEEGKKAHERKLAEQSEAHTKVKKQFESQLQEGKKLCVSQQAELRTARSKLAAVDRANALASKERHKRDEQEAKLKQAHAGTETALAEALKQATQSRDEVEAARQEARRVNVVCAEQSNLIKHLRGLLQISAQQFGRLVQASVPKEAYESASMSCAALRLRIVRLERKFADRDAQMQEIAYLVRAMESHQHQLLACLECAETSLKRVTDQSNERLKESLYIDEHAQEPTVRDNSWELAEEREKTRLLRVDLRGAQIYVKLGEERLARAHALCTELADQLLELEVSRDTLETELTALKDQHAAALTERECLVTKVAELDRRARHAKVEEAHWKKQMQEVEARAVEEDARWADAVKAEKMTARKLASAVQQAKMREEALQADVEGLQGALEAIAPYEQLFMDAVHLLKEASARNALAEAETERLSRFNAEIISQANPQNRIHYLERVRRQLAETQQKLILSTRDRDELEEENDALRHELELYKSVPADTKMRTTMTRISRPPVTARSSSTASSATLTSDTEDCEEEDGEDGAAFAANPADMTVRATREADMTLDELM